MVIGDNVNHLILVLEIQWLLSVLNLEVKRKILYLSEC